MFSLVYNHLEIMIIVFVLFILYVQSQQVLLDQPFCTIEQTNQTLAIKRVVVFSFCFFFVFSVLAATVEESEVSIYLVALWNHIKSSALTPEYNVD